VCTDTQIHRYRYTDTDTDTQRYGYNTLVACPPNVEIPKARPTRVGSFIQGDEWPQSPGQPAKVGNIPLQGAGVAAAKTAFMLLKIPLKTTVACETQIHQGIHTHTLTARGVLKSHTIVVLNTLYTCLSGAKEPPIPSSPRSNQLALRVILHFFLKLSLYW